MRNEVRQCPWPIICTPNSILRLPTRLISRRDRRISEFDEADNFERKFIAYPNAFEEVKTISRSVVEVAQSTDEVVWPRNICRRSSAAWQIQAQNRAVSSASEKCSNGTTTASTDTSRSSRNLCGRTDRSTPRPS